MRFLAAPPLGRLCRWLRTLGFDCEYVPHEEADRFGPSDDRIYLSRRAETARRRVIFIGRDTVFDQLCVMERLVSIGGRSHPLTRCIQCNTPLREADRRVAKERVPEHVFLTHDRFTRCGSCGRIYWPGTHVDRIEERIARLFGPTER